MLTRTGANPSRAAAHMRASTTGLTITPRSWRTPEPGPTGVRAAYFTGSAVLLTVKSVVGSRLTSGLYPKGVEFS